MEELSFKDIFNFLKKKLWLFIIIFLVTFVGGSIYSLFFKTPIYKSSTSIVLSGDGKSKISQNDISLNKSLSSTYAEIAKSRQVLGRTIEDLDLDTSYESLAKKVTVSTVSDTVILKIAIESENATESKEIADSVAKHFIEEISSIYDITNIRVLDEAVVASAPTNINLIKDELTYGVLGIILGLGVIFVIFYFKQPEASKQESKQPTFETRRQTAKV